MKQEDEAIVLSVRKFSERDLLVSVLMREHGVHRSIVSGGMAKKQRAIWQVGSHVHAVWQARLPEQMGNIRGELLDSWGMQSMQSALALSAVSSISALLDSVLMERDAHPALYDVATGLLGAISKAPKNAESSWFAEYACFEYWLLEESGFGLDLSACAASGVTENLVYVSPKSGRAVSQEEGLPYHKKLLPLPPFLLAMARGDTPQREEAPTLAEILDSMTLTGYFIEQEIYAIAHRQMPSARRRLHEGLQKRLTVSAAG